jgi:hypothetical protein
MKRLILPVVATTSFVLSFGAVAGLVANSQAVANSDRFWSVGAVRGMSAEHYDSLADLSQSADLVVVGRVEEVRPGREWVAMPELLDDPSSEMTPGRGSRPFVSRSSESSGECGHRSATGATWT